jgi:hypothetical protein
MGHLYSTDITIIFYCLGAGCREFESLHPDQQYQLLTRFSLFKIQCKLM